jgi:glucokinase
MRIVAVDLGGTHARFAVAELHADRRPTLGKSRKYRTAEHAGLAAAWTAFARDEGEPLPEVASIAIAGPIGGELIRFTNNHWTIRPATFAAELGIDRSSILLNDFAAMAAAVGTLGETELEHIGGPRGPLTGDGVTTVIGPGTGLGVAQVLRRRGRAVTIPTEGGHLDFAALDDFEEALARRLRRNHGRVSTERIVSGPALSFIREAIASLSDTAIIPRDDAALWAVAIDGSDRFGRLALERLVMSLGSVAGDLALAHGANCVVITGGLANRIAEWIKGPLFNDRFQAKGRFSARMGEIPIRLAAHPDPGLLGAAVAYQETQWR